MLSMINNTSNKQIMSPLATILLTQQAALDEKLNSLHDILNKAERGPMGMTLDSAKTPEWREAKRLYNTYFSQLRSVNQQLNRLRKCVGYEAVNGKRVAIYKYK